MAIPDPSQPGAQASVSATPGAQSPGQTPSPARGPRQQEQATGTERPQPPAGRSGGQSSQQGGSRSPQRIAQQGELGADDAEGDAPR